MEHIVKRRRGSQRKEKITYAKALRSRLTPAEEILWKALRNKQCGGVKFRRQAPFGDYIVDFCSMNPAIVIEIDGGIHMHQKEYDTERENLLKQRGFSLLRFSNEQIHQNLALVLEQIALVIGKLQTHPSSPEDGRRG